MATSAIGGRKPVAASDTSSAQAPLAAPRAASGPQLNSGPGPTRDGVERVRAADIGAVHGTSKAKLPQLLSDWQRATVQAAIRCAAEQVIAPDVDKALERAVRANPLMSEEDLAQKADDIAAKLMPAAMRQVAPQLEANPAKTISDAVTAFRAELPLWRAKKDILFRIVHTPPAARGDERAIWENGNYAAIVDMYLQKRFGVSHVLVVPKRQVSVPVELTPAELDELAKISAAVAEAFKPFGDGRAGDVWINAPQDLTQPQLHVHVDTGVAQGTPPAALAKVYDSVAGVLKKQLG